jgi:hypothetical protein
MMLHAVRDVYRVVTQRESDPVADGKNARELVPLKMPEFQSKRESSGSR